MPDCIILGEMCLPAAYIAVTHSVTQFPDGLSVPDLERMVGFYC